VQEKEKAHRFETVWAFPKGGCAMFEVIIGVIGVYFFIFESISYFDTHNTTSPSI
jgi:hypothetical protein